MFVDPIIMQFPENLDSENFVIATYYCATKPTTNMVKFAAALAIEQTCGTWLKVPGETPEVRERAIGRVVGVYEAPSYQIGIPADVTERHFIVRIAYPWHNFGAQFSMMLSTVIGRQGQADRSGVPEVLPRRDEGSEVRRSRHPRAARRL